MLFVCVVFGVLAVGQAALPVVDSPLGAIKGTLERVLDVNVEEFLGVPYAKPPVGELRFALPQPYGTVGQWTAMEYRPGCAQPVEPANAQQKPGVSEDCLYLNIFRRQGSSRRSFRPVIVIIHGGGFTNGSASEISYDAAPLSAAGDVITVSINYRLGVLGFADMKDLAPGNLGLFDQRLALQWIRSNIQVFGGDPNKVTLLGVSSGSMSVHAQIISPLNKGEKLFHAAILDGGVLVSSFTTDSDSSFTLVKNTAKALRCPSEGVEMLACLRNVTVEKFFDPSLKVEGLNSMVPFMPTEDGVFLPKNSLKNPESLVQNYNRARTIMGFAKDEGSLFVHFMLGTQSLTDVKSEDSFLKLCEKVARMFRLPLDLKNNGELRSALVSNYFKQHKNVASAIGQFVTDGVFACPMLRFAKNYSNYSNGLYLYRFDRRFNGTYQFLDPNLLGAFHYSPFLHFTGSLLGGGNPTPVEAVDKRFFIDAMTMVFKFANLVDGPVFRRVALPDFSKGEGILVVDEKPSVSLEVLSHQDTVCRTVFPSSASSSADAVTKTD